MTGNEIARRTGSYGQASLTERQQYALALAGAGEMVPKSFWTKPAPNPGGGIIPARPNPGAILYMLETAAMLGVSPMVGLTNIHIIEGKPSLSANLLAALVREAGHKLRVWTDGEGDDVRAIATLTRHDDPDFTYKVVWGKPEMVAAGLQNKDNWKKYRRSMLKARALTEVIREGAPEVAMGAAYTPEELRPDIAVNAEGEPIEMQPVPEHQSAPQQAAPAAPAEPRQEAPIVDRPIEPDEFNWAKALAEAPSKEAVSALYQRARMEGKLAMPITIGKETVELGQHIIAVGTAFAEAEATGESLPDEAPAVLAEEVVEAVIEPDEPTARDIRDSAEMQSLTMDSHQMAREATED